MTKLSPARSRRPSCPLCRLSDTRSISRSPILSPTFARRRRAPRRNWLFPTPPSCSGCWKTDPDFSGLAELRQRVVELDARVRRHRPDQVLALQRQRLGNIRSALMERFNQQFRARRDRVARVGDMLRLLSPEHTIGRGYSITSTHDGKVVRAIGDVEAGSEIQTRLRDGKLLSVVRTAIPESGREPDKTGQRET